jgi:hypothetical protein
MQHNTSKLNSLHEQYISAMNVSNKPHMTDKELEFWMVMSDSKMVFENNDNMKMFLLKLISSIINDYSKSFVKTHAEFMFEKVKHEYTQLINTLKELEKKHVSLSFSGLFVASNTLLFLERITSRILIMFLDDDTVETIDKLTQKLSALLKHTKRVLDGISVIDKSFHQQLKTMLRKVTNYKHLTNSSDIEKVYKNVEIENSLVTDTQNVNVAQFSTILDGIGIDEEFEFTKQLYSIKDAFLEIEGTQAKHMKQWIEHLQNKIMSEYVNLFTITKTRKLLDAVDWETLKANIKKVEVRKLSYLTLTRFGGILLFLLRETRKLIYIFRLGMLENEDSMYDFVYDFEANTKKTMYDLVNVTIEKLRLLPQDEQSSQQSLHQLRKTANAFDKSIIDANLKDIDNHIVNFKVLAKNMIELFSKFASNTNNQHKIRNAKLKGISLLQDALPVLKQTTDFVNLYIQRSQKNTKTVHDEYDNLALFLEEINNINGLESAIKSKVQTVNESFKIKRQLQSLLYPSSIAYFKCLELYELLSGTIRVVVRKKFNADGQSPYSIYYNIQLDHAKNMVSFEGVQDLYKLNFEQDYNKNNIEFGPFYKLYPQNETDTPDIVAKHIVKDALNIDTLINMVTQHSTNVVLYSYGYSGSGKTFNFFGMLGKQETWKYGLVWELLDTLGKIENVSIKLVKRIKVYGVLEPYVKDGGASKRQQQQVKETTTSKFVFKDTVWDGKYDANNQEVKSWVSTIEQDLNSSLDKESFVKATSNNSESSRGFYILKFEISYGNNKSFIGVVDMAGNEDPYDISNAMIPTMDMSKFKSFINGQLIVSVYDVVYQEIKKVITNIILTTVIMIVSLQRNGYLYDGFIDVITEKEGQVSELQQHMGIMINVKTKLIDMVKRFPPSQKNSIPTDTEQLSNEFLQRVDEALNKQQVSLLVLDKKTCAIRWWTQNGTTKFQLKFVVNQEVVIEILKFAVTNLQKDIQKIKNKNKQLDEDKLFNLTTSSLPDIQIISTKAKTNEHYETLLKFKKLKYVYDIMSNTQMQWKDINITINDITSELLSSTPSFDKNFLKSCKKEQRDTIQNSISSFFKDLKYIVPVKNKAKENVYYNYSTLSQIVREGFYINKANAELIHFFKRKRNFEDPIFTNQDNIHDTEKTQYEFDGNFDFKTYDKFAVQFPSNTSKEVTRYDTSLVKTIYNEFGDENIKHIMFACVRDDNEVDKIVGAISTLYLVQDLKST